MGSGAQEPAGLQDDDTIVVRFGIMEIRDLETNARDHEDEASGEYAVSVAAFPGMDADQITAAYPMRHGRYCKSTVGTLRDAGFELRWAPPPHGHCDLILPGEPTDELLNGLRSQFTDPPSPNLHRIGGVS